MAVLYLEMVGLSHIMTVDFYGLNVAMTSNVEEWLCFNHFKYSHAFNAHWVYPRQWGYVCDSRGMSVTVEVCP